MVRTKGFYLNKKQLEQVVRRFHVLETEMSEVGIIFGIHDPSLIIVTEASPLYPYVEKADVGVAVSHDHPPT